MGSSGLDACHPLPQELSLPSSYLTAIRYTNLSQEWLHRPSGRAVIFGDHIFYSPNSSLVPPPPPPAEQQLLRDPVKDNVAEFHQPRWWTPSSAYLPFLPTFPNFHCPPFHILFHDPGTHGRNRIQMDSRDALEWANLEQRLKCAVKQFQSGYAIPACHIVPIVATSLACQGIYRYSSQFEIAETRCRAWFSIWMAIISFCIAVAQVTDGEDDAIMCPAWFRCLVRHVDETTASGLRQQLSQFTGTYARAGVFLNLLDDTHLQRPSVEFYVRFGIPVWYPWGHREEALARANPAGFGRFVPPPHLLQAPQSFLTKELVVDQADNEYPWEHFFEERKRRAENAGPVSRKRPTLKVFLWQQDSEGKWMRVLVHNKEKQATLQKHGRHQKVFDELTNEWDCCESMGNLDPDERQATYWSVEEPDLLIGWRSGSPPTLFDPHTSAAFPTITSNAVQCPNLKPTPKPSLVSLLPSSKSNQQCYTEQSADPTASWASTHVGGDAYCFSEVNDPSDVLCLFYGFVPPPYAGDWLCFPAYKDNGIEAQNLAKGIGKINISSAYINSSLGQAAVKFFWSISQKDFVPPRSEMYDLAYNNISNIKKSPRISYMRKLPGNIFIFAFKDCATIPWSIGVTNIVDAMFILRLDSLLDDYQIACQLLNRGVRFLTLLKLPAFATVAAPTSIPRIRLSDYQFVVGDYNAYCHECNEMLRNTRISRGALKRGGILWRLAIGTASFQDVLSGPSTAVTLRRQCMSLNPSDNLMWCDDSLDQTETDMLCGVYYVFTGQSSQQAKKSWWPPVQVWENNMRLGFWNDEYEFLYNTRLQELQSGTAVPLTSEQWRQRIRPFAVVRRAFDHTSKSANILLESLL